MTTITPYIACLLFAIAWWLEHRRRVSAETRLSKFGPKQRNAKGHFVKREKGSAV